MSRLLECGNCGSKSIDLSEYSSMIVVAPEHALFSVKCPVCGKGVSSMRKIPGEMRDEVLFAAIEVGAGMGRSC